MNKVGDKLLKQIIDVMHKNRRTSGRFSYTVPSPESYPYQWFWDSCFHAIILSHFEPAAAKNELRALAHWQFKSGMMPHMIYWRGVTKTSFPKIRWGKRRTSSFIQPPMLAYAVLRTHQVDPDTDFLKHMLPVIHRLHNFLFRQRDPRHHHLVGIINPDESGEDNSPRFDTALHLPAKQKYVQNQDDNYRQRMLLLEQFRRAGFLIKGGMDRQHWVRDVPFNTILVENLRAEAQIAQTLGLDDHAAAAQARAERVERAMREIMLEGEIMWSTVGLNYRHIRIKTWAIFAPLFAGLLTPNEAATLVSEHLRDESEFATPYRIPTVALDEPSFDPAGFWRGPVWMSTNWFVHRGLVRYGFHEEAALIAKGSRDLLAKSGFREQYHPLTGEGMGAQDFTWGGLVIDMVDK